ncbi:outer membrane protein OmpA-like peptidoglycan-associated protein [Haloactinospora alba]|uniref:Outer membrane protein OmpA-like peptidoglycan-associated protein n=1 Tax=Haloactinospora alba TaxID=405555 RepID=A0A543NGD2_9ACTN|nr:OmpA family protein [Haloactinospora alba]TQN30909.1 outer membrane protein OmpA-like peptidoglycan-associated protein [Haloactinospora alba]
MRSLFTLRTFALVSTAVLLASGCGPDGENGGDEEEPQPATEAPDGPYLREGVFGDGVSFRAALEVDTVERRADRTVLEYTVTPLQEGEHSARGAFEKGIRLLDPLGQRLYERLPDSNYDAGSGEEENAEDSEDGSEDGDGEPEDGSEDGEAPEETEDAGDGAEAPPRHLGSELPDTVVGGAEYRLEAHFPPLPDDTGRLTVLTPGTTGEFTGVPVTDAPEEDEENGGENSGEDTDSGEDADEDGSDDSGDGEVAAGDTVQPPVTAGPLPGEPGTYATDLYAISEDGALEYDTSAGRQRITVSADELFTGDDEELAEGTAATLDTLAQQVDGRAGTDGPTVSVTVHTGGDRDSDRAQELSQQRAQAVRDYLNDELGDDYQYEAQGGGSEEPLVAGDDAQENKAQRRNSRVEVSYPRPSAEEDTQDAADEDSEGETGGEPEKTETPSVEPQDGGEPATYRAEDGDAVASETATIGGHEYTLRVLPFYRDGAYLVANFRVTSKSPDEIDEDTDAFTGTDYPGAEFGSFSARDPESGETYRGVRVGQQRAVGEETTGHDYLGPVSYPYVTRENSTNRAWVYLSAPAEDVSSLTLDAGGFGEFEDVPVR